MPSIAIKSYDLSSYQPDYYKNSDVMAQINASNETELLNLYTYLQDLKAQLRIETATWSLSRWEENYGLSILENETYAYRRAMVYSAKQGYGTLTKARLKELALKFWNTEIDITEDYANYSFSISFTDTKGIPKYINDFKKFVNKLKPSHLSVDYVYKYNTWKYVEGYKWGELEKYTWDEVLNNDLVHDATYHETSAKVGQAIVGKAKVGDSENNN